jgi:hypothetical protein
MPRITWIAIGTVMGASVGVGTHEVAAGVGIGLATGIALSLVQGSGGKGS